MGNMHDPRRRTVATRFASSIATYGRYAAQGRQEEQR